LENLLVSLGINGIGFLMLYFYMNKTFKETEDIRKNNSENIDKLCIKIDKLIDLMHERIVYDTQLNAVIKEQLIEIQKNQEYFKMEISTLREKVERIDIRTALCPNVRKEVC